MAEERKEHGVYGLTKHTYGMGMVTIMDWHGLGRIKDCCICFTHFMGGDGRKMRDG
jgi:hypothetical protein